MFRNRGAGRFEATRSIACGAELVAATVGDLDGDKKLDLVTVSGDRMLEIRLGLSEAATQRSALTLLPDLLELEPDVLIITGDHSTPARLRSHSWHPVPTLLWAPETHLTDVAVSFGEREAQRGGLGHFPATELMPLALAHALRLEKYGA